MSAASMRLVMPRGTSPRMGAATAPDSFAAEVAMLLGRRPRRLPPQALYDALGSALLDTIAPLPWYSIARAETALLRTHGRTILEAAGRRARLVELGPGTGEKMATLLQGTPRARVQPVDVHLIDVSATALEAASGRVRRVTGATVHTHLSRYQAGLHVVAGERRAGETLMVALLGATIGQFEAGEAEALLHDARQALRPGDTLLLGADLVKPVERLMAAYDDPHGVTAAFNGNLLQRLNRDLDADFRLDRFAHDVRWQPQARRLEMHLVSLVAQRVRIPGAGLTIDFEPGETIWTESACKFEPSAVDALLTTAGLLPAATWHDEDDGYLLTLAVAR